MSFATLLGSLLPQDDKFLHQLELLAHYAKESTAQLVTLIHSDHPAQRIQAGEDIRRIKAQAKAELSTLTTEVCRTFITPFDREDLQEMAACLYNIPKHNDKIQDRLLTHNLLAWQNDFAQLADVAARQSIIMDDVMTLLHGSANLPAMNAKVEAIHELEDQGDRLLGEWISRAFKELETTPSLILRKDVYELLEDISDSYRDCANVALRIVLKHS
ncbi:MAG: DUF47 family protein [Vampirovibrionales bacterium]|nr:DUF47 family protein [Vampirovibrionales bacterium]